MKSIAEYNAKNSSAPTASASLARGTGQLAIPAFAPKKKKTGLQSARATVARNCTRSAQMMNADTTLASQSLVGMRKSGIAAHNMHFGNLISSRKLSPALLNHRTSTSVMCTKSL